MEEIITVQDHFYILATSSRIEERSRVLKHGDTFAVLDRQGNIRPIGLGEHGLYHAGTRFLSRLDLSLGGLRPLYLSSTIEEHNTLLTVDLANPDISRDGEVLLPRDTVHVFREIFLWNGACYHRLRLRNYLSTPIVVDWTLEFAADFADIFEVRGTRRPLRGTLLPPVVDRGGVRLAYRGLDGQVRTTILQFDPPPGRLRAGAAEFQAHVPGNSETACELSVACQGDERPVKSMPFPEGLAALQQDHRQLGAGDVSIRTSNEQLNGWLRRSSDDLHLMVTRTPHGPYPYAGIPWFSTPFGRDGLIAALEFLWINPDIARGVLQYLAARQASSIEPERDAEPGKILHETRLGEMAALSEIPFGQYYGSLDATPLFVMLAGAYYERTADRNLIQTLWPHLQAALAWIDEFGDLDGDGFVEYSQQSRRGLSNQCWKDSHDSIFHADGTLAEGPIAPCEIQGYVYAARQAGARLASLLGNHDEAHRLTEQAEKLRIQFESAFWCEELSTYALALDGRKRPCRVRTSNPGHCLFAGIVSAERALRVADSLLSDNMYSGWGVRTVADNESRYNPMSYHNGSVWPHDNAIIAAGLARYRLTNHVLELFTALFDASLSVELQRLPELYCGFSRRPGAGPTLYPVACSPQSWSAGAVFLLMQSLLGLRIDAPARRLEFIRPALPETLDRVWIEDLRIGSARVDLAFERYPLNVGVELLERRGDLEIVVVK